MTASPHEAVTPAPRELPILFSAPMARAILAGTKTQTRRLFKLPPWLAKRSADLARAFPDKAYGVTPCLKVPYDLEGDEMVERVRNPWGFPDPGGVRLWVREAWRAWEREGDGLDHIWFRADDAKIEIPDTKACGDFVVGKFDKWRPGIHMPRWASRITLSVVDVRAERLQDITEEDAEAEGVEAMDGLLDDADLCRRAKEMGGTATDARVWFAALWDLINGKRAPWASNPWLWRVAFPRFTR